MELPNYIKITGLDEETGIVKSLEVKTIEGLFIMDRSRIQGKDFITYRSTLMKGDMEKAIQNMIAKLTVTEDGTTAVSMTDVMMKDISLYQRLNKGMQLIIGDNEDFLQ